MKAAFLVLLACACSPDTVTLACEHEDAGILHVPETALPWIDQPSALFPDTLVLNPDPELVPYVLEAIRDSQRIMGLLIEIGQEGIPVSIQPEVEYKGNSVDAIAHYDEQCEFSGCLASNTYIAVSKWMLQDKKWALPFTIKHEIAHILSGWGRRFGALHLPIGNLMAPGCRDHVCPTWTDADVELVCSAAPCRWINL